MSTGMTSEETTVLHYLNVFLIGRIRLLGFSVGSVLNWRLPLLDNWKCHNSNERLYSRSGKNDLFFYVHYISLFFHLSLYLFLRDDDLIEKYGARRRGVRECVF